MKGEILTIEYRRGSPSATLVMRGPDGSISRVTMAAAPLIRRLRDQGQFGSLVEIVETDEFESGEYGSV